MMLSKNNLKLSEGRGFTLLEVMLSLTIITALSIGVSTSYGVIRLADAQSCASTIKSALSLGNDLAETTTSQTWGIKINTSGTTIYKGAQYSSRDTSYDIPADFQANCNISGTDEYTFTFADGAKSSTGTTTVSSANYVEIISVNQLGQRY